MVCGLQIYLFFNSIRLTYWIPITLFLKATVMTYCSGWSHGHTKNFPSCRPPSPKMTAAAAFPWLLLCNHDSPMIILLKQACCCSFLFLLTRILQLACMSVLIQTNNPYFFSLLLLWCTQWVCLIVHSKSSDKYYKTPVITWQKYWILFQTMCTACMHWVRNLLASLFYFWNCSCMYFQDCTAAKLNLNFWQKYRVFCYTQDLLVY